MHCGCIQFLYVELMVSVRWLQKHLHSRWDTFFLPCCSVVNQEALLLSSHACPMCLLLLLTPQTLRWPPLCIWHMVIIPSFLRLNAIESIYFFTGHILLIQGQRAQNRIGRFCQTSSILLCLQATLMPERFVLCCLDIQEQHNPIQKPPIYTNHPIL